MEVVGIAEGEKEIVKDEIERAFKVTLPEEVRKKQNEFNFNLLYSFFCYFSRSFSSLPIYIHLFKRNCLHFPIFLI